MKTPVSLRTYLPPVFGGLLFFTLVVLAVVLLQGRKETTPAATGESVPVVVHEDISPQKEVSLTQKETKSTRDQVIVDEATSSPSKKVLPPPPTETIVQQVPDPVVEMQKVQPSQEEIASNLSIADKQLRSALVNIICIASPESPARSISGSGIIIDSRGTILTNAHIAQEFLLKDYPTKDSVECTIRTGNIAKSTYEAELTYISPAWVIANSDSLTKANPTGTGEDDFALLSITKSLTKDPLPAAFNHVALDFGEQQKNEVVLAAGYPASFLDAESIRRNLVLVSSAATVRDVFTFTGNTVDVISLGGVPLAQQGSSGGGVANVRGELIGIVVTSSLSGATSNRDLRAITLGHINRSFVKQSGVALPYFLAGNLTFEREQFMSSIAPLLETLLLKSFGITS